MADRRRSGPRAEGRSKVRSTDDTDAAMIARLTDRDRRRIIRRVDELAALAALMAQPGTLASPPAVTR
jgi:hypothetical protein